MKTFIGTKLILALAMTRAEFVSYRYPNQPHNPDAGSPDDPGYLVEYTDGGPANHPDHAGYISWSPKDVFEGAYLPVGDVTGLQPHQVRVVAEKAQLDDKFEKLTAFQSTEMHAKLSSSEQHRLSIQWNAMKTYSRILGERIAAFGGDQ